MKVFNKVVVEAWPTAVQNPHLKPVVDNGQLFAVVDLGLVGYSELAGQTADGVHVQRELVGLDKVVDCLGRVGKTILTFYTFIIK